MNRAHKARGFFIRLANRSGKRDNDNREDLLKIKNDLTTNCTDFTDFFL